tara:strand:- start:567 stop:1016 length:450 start_codon:yes stop_codon:yes gene_type:complete
MLMQEEKKIVWEKWRDPYSFDESYSNTEDFLLKSTEDVREFEELEEELEGIAEEEGYSMTEEQMLKFVVTESGAIPINSNFSIDKIFNFWTGHTNFSITPDIALQIERVGGVEVLDIVTRYRFRVGVGKLFKGNEVMSSVQRAIRNHVE